MVSMATKVKPVPYADKYRWFESRSCISAGKLGCKIKKMKNPIKNIRVTNNEKFIVFLKEGKRFSSQSSVREHDILVIMIVDPMIVPTIAMK
jgi:hypothetical protein